MFQSDLYRHHNASQYPTKWIVYEACSFDEKTRFFDSLTPHSNTMLAHIHSGRDAIPLEFAIQLSIIDTFIGDMFFHPDDQGGTTQTTALKLFKHVDNGDESY